MATNSLQARAAAASSVDRGSPAFRYLTAYAFEADAFEGAGWTTPPISIRRESDAIILCSSTSATIPPRAFPPKNFYEPCGRYSDFRFSKSGRLSDFSLDGVDVNRQAYYWPPPPRQQPSSSAKGLVAHLISVIASPNGDLDVVVLVTNNSAQSVSWFGPNRQLSDLRTGSRPIPRGAYIDGDKCFRPTLWATPAIHAGYAARLLLGFSHARFGGTLVLVANTGAVLRLRVSESPSVPAASNATGCSFARA